MRLYNVFLEWPMWLPKLWEMYVSLLPAINGQIPHQLLYFMVPVSFMAHCKMCQSWCFCSWKTFWHMFHVLIYSTEFKWWNIYKFCHKSPGVQVQASSVIFELKRVLSSGSFLDKKYGRQKKAVLTNDETEAKSEHSPHKSLDWIAQKHMFWPLQHRGQLKCYVYCHIKLRQVQATNDGNYERRVVM
jgi:hypothetical protein